MVLKANSPKDIFIHIAIMLVITAGIIMGFFYWYLPMATNHGETIAVPKLTGLSLSEIESVLNSKNLRYAVNDSSYAPGKKPLTVLSQHPLEGTQVKENRKIYISISTKNPPKVKMPKLIDGSLKSAEISLKSYNLFLGNVKFVSSPYLNLVVDQKVNGKSISAGTLISKGSKVDLEVGNGSGGQTIEVPDLVGMEEEEAKALLSEKGLLPGLIKIEPSDEKDGTVTKQNPESGNIKTGEMVDLWISGEN
ncbi:MAG TPA: PASTA domain-containing protein [Cytophagaceae bacterium]|jgi:beta-lactam-binding protein with PASTA domain